MGGELLRPVRTHCKSTGRATASAADSGSQREAHVFTERSTDSLPRIPFHTLAPRIRIPRQVQWEHRKPVSQKVLVVYREIAEVQPYARAIEAAGLTPLLEEAGPGITLGSCCGLLLTGGGDVDPALYGETALPETQAPDADRDSAESALIEEALVRDLPLLAICRGMQLLNVHLGGSLVQASSHHIPPREAYARPWPARPSSGDRARYHAGDHRATAGVAGELASSSSCSPAGKRSASQRARSGGWNYRSHRTSPSALRARCTVAPGKSGVRNIRAA